MWAPGFLVICASCRLRAPMEECAVLKEIDRPLGQGLPSLAKPKGRIGIQRSTIISVAAAARRSSPFPQRSRCARMG
jgi:hypothetical protein